MRTHLWLLRYDRTIHMVDDRAARTEQIDSVMQEAIGRHAFPYRVQRRKMLADVAETAGAQ